MHPLDNKSIGYFDSPELKEAAYDPGIEGVNCLVCMKPLALPVVTISVMAYYRRGYSFFYRLHKACDLALTDKERNLYDSTIIDHLNDDRLEAPHA